MMMMMKWWLMSSDVSWHIRDKLWPMPKHGSINLYVHGNQKAQDGHLDSHTAPELSLSLRWWWSDAYGYATDKGGLRPVTLLLLVSGERETDRQTDREREREREVWPSGKASQKGRGSISLWLSFFFEKAVVCGHCLVTLSSQLMKH